MCVLLALSLSLALFSLYTHTNTHSHSHSHTDKYNTRIPYTFHASALVCVQTTRTHARTHPHNNHSFSSPLFNVCFLEKEPAAI